MCMHLWTLVLSRSTNVCYGYEKKANKESLIPFGCDILG